MLKGYRRMSYLVLSQMESITAKRFKLLIRTERKWRACKKEKYEKYIFVWDIKKVFVWNIKSICMRWAGSPRRLAVKHGPLRTAHRCQDRPLNNIIHHWAPPTASNILDFRLILGIMVVFGDIPHQIFGIFARHQGQYSVPTLSFRRALNFLSSSTVCNGRD